MNDAERERKLMTLLIETEETIRLFKNYHNVLSELEKRGLVRRNTDGTYELETENPKLVSDTVTKALSERRK